MNNIKTILCAAWTLVLVSTGTVLMADSSNFAGPYIGISGLSAGIEAKGDSRDGDGDTNDRVQFGKTTFGAGIEGGYALPIGSMFLLDVGASYLSGEAKINHENDSNTATHSKGVSFAADDFVTLYIAPTVALSETSSVYLKWGYSEADISITGDVTTPADLRGETMAIGTRTVLDSGIFIKTEAGYTEYNGISAHGAGAASTGAISTTTAYSAEPGIAYGSVSLGFRF